MTSNKDKIQSMKSELTKLKERNDQLKNNVCINLSESKKMIVKKE